MARRIKIGGTFFTEQEIRQAVAFGNRVVRGKPLFNVPGKRSFDRLRSASPDFKREVRSGTAGRLGKLQPFQKIQFGDAKIKQIQQQQQITLSPESRLKIRQQVAKQFIAPRQSRILDSQLQQIVDRQTRLAPQRTVTPFKLPPGTTRTQQNLFNLKRQQEALRQKKQREGRDFSFKEKRKLASLQIQRTALEIALIPKGIFDFARAVKRDPSVIKTIPGSFKEAAVRDAQLLRLDPTSGIIKIAGEVFVFVGSGKVIRVVGKVGSKASARLSPKFKGVEKGKIEIPSGQAGKKTISIEIIQPGLKKIKVPLKEQVKLAGKKVSVVTSAQADQLVTLIKKEKIVRKPIPNEAKLTRKTKRLLKKFDNRKLTPRQLILLDRRLRQETGGQ